MVEHYGNLKAKLFSPIDVVLGPNPPLYPGASRSTHSYFIDLFSSKVKGGRTWTDVFEEYSRFVSFSPAPNEHTSAESLRQASENIYSLLKPLHLVFCEKGPFLCARLILSFLIINASECEPCLYEPKRNDEPRLCRVCRSPLYRLEGASWIPVKSQFYVMLSEIIAMVLLT